VAGRGPTPKDPSIRQRRNKNPAAANLPADVPVAIGARKLRPLGPHPNREPWHQRTRDWWVATWRSVVSEKYLAIDVHHLQQLAVLIDDFWKAKDSKARREAHQEIRLALAPFGQTALDRWRLHWMIHENPLDPTAPPAPTPAPTKPRASRQSGEDPRKLLTMVPKSA